MMTLMILAVSVVELACQSSPKKDSSTLLEPPSKHTKIITCKDPRPEICTKEYRPVCAEVDTGLRCVKAPCASKDHKTYSNACTACADHKVFGYRFGTCR